MVGYHLQCWPMRTRNLIYFGAVVKQEVARLLAKQRRTRKAEVVGDYAGLAPLLRFEIRGVVSAASLLDLRFRKTIPISHVNAPYPIRDSCSPAGRTEPTFRLLVITHRERSIFRSEESGSPAKIRMRHTRSSETRRQRQTSMSRSPTREQARQGTQTKSSVPSGEEWPTEIDGSA